MTNPSSNAAVKIPQNPELKPRTLPARKASKEKKPREWAPRFWEGMNLSAWARVLVQNHFRVGFMQLYIAISISIVSCFHTVLEYLQNLIYGEQIRNFELKHAPIFVIGHWRTGTTLLHELLSLDEQHTFPTSAQCMAPNNMIFMEPILHKYLWFLSPEKRPMDNMKAGWGCPQEDEFALCNMGAPSPYLKIAFPNSKKHDTEFFDLDRESKEDVELWKKSLLHFVKCVAFKSPDKRIVLKSPPHTSRIKVLKEIFPNAKFVHITRHPYKVYPSTVNLWKKLYATQGMQTPTFAGLEDYVIRCMQLMYAKFPEQRSLLESRDYAQIKYEDLVANPVREMHRIYDRLGLDHFDGLRSELDKRAEELAGFKTNNFKLDQATRERLNQEWRQYFEDFGYAPEV